MYPIVNAFYQILKGRIKIDDEPVTVVHRLKRRDQTPCLTIEQAAEIQMKRDYRTDETQRIIFENNVEIWVNVLCDTEEERHTIIKQIQLLFFNALGNHYSLCSHYNETDNSCSFINDTCEALTVKNARTFKSQCPHPQKNDYTSWFKEFHIIKNSFKLSGIQDMDELEIAEPLLRTLIKFDLNYITSHDLGGIVPEELIFDEELL